MERIRTRHERLNYLLSGNAPGECVRKITTAIPYGDLVGDLLGVDKNVGDMDQHALNQFKLKKKKIRVKL